MYSISKCISRYWNSQRRNIQHFKIIPSFHAEIEWIPYFSSHEIPESLIAIKFIVLKIRERKKAAACDTKIAWSRQHWSKNNTEESGSRQTNWRSSSEYGHENRKKPKYKWNKQKDRRALLMVKLCRKQLLSWEKVYQIWAGEPTLGGISAPLQHALTS